MITGYRFEAARSTDVSGAEFDGVMWSVPPAELAVDSVTDVRRNGLFGPSTKSCARAT